MRFSRSRKSRFDDTTSYQGLDLDTLEHRSSEEALRPKVDLKKHDQLNTDRCGWFTWLIQIACLAWAVPIVYLLYLNFSQHLVGASAWCPNDDCQVDWFDPATADPERNLYRYDHWSHNFLGILQLVAKALEVWFALIAAALVYLITFIIAGKKDGLPVGYLMRPVEFAGIPALFDPLLWKTLPPVRKFSWSGRRLYFRLYLYVGLTSLLCVICNLMGPGIAVLAIPSLQWIDTAYIGSVTYYHDNGNSPPGVDQESFFWQNTYYCAFETLNASNYSCAASPFASQLDSWISTYITAGELLTDDMRGLSQQDTVRFVVNITSQSTKENSDAVIDASEVVHWVPNRQVLASLSYDRVIVESISSGYNESATRDFLNDSGLVATITDLGLDYATYVEYNSSLELIVQRNGPIFGTMANMWADYNSSMATTTIIGQGRFIRCYPDYDLYWTPLVEGTSSGLFTKCIMIGEAWGPNNKMNGFSIDTRSSPETNSSQPATNGSTISVEIYSSDKAVFLPNGTFPSWCSAECLRDGDAPLATTCEYDRLFTLNENTPIANRTSHVNTIEMTLASDDGLASTTLVVDFVAFYSFTLYTLDPSPITNPLYIAQTQDLPKNGTSFPLDPAWLLAAWTVDANGTLYANRTSTITLVTELQRLLADEGGLYSRTEWEIDYVSLLPIIQTLSIVDFATSETAETGAEKQRRQDPENPLLQRNARLWIWAYGLSSRTSILGAAVATVGVVIVLVQFVLGFVDRRQYRSPTQLLVAALEHAPADEFKDFAHDETRVARVAFHVKETHTGAGNLTFHRFGP